MFISVKHLHGNMGVDEEIARFFVDRKIPENNVFWQKKLLYVTRGNGYISIPVYYDLLYRMGLPKSCLIEESHIVLMERIMHYAMQVEFQQISSKTQLDEIEKLLIGRTKNPVFFSELVDYLDQPILKPKGKLGKEISALNRADVFLFILCDLPLDKGETEKAIQFWYALHTSYLLMDDIYDYQFDKQNLEENAVIELGDGEEGSIKAYTTLQANLEVLYQINPALSSFFELSIRDLKKSTNNPF